MYLEHYSLKEKPFEMSPAPRFLWLGEKHLEALATLKYGISEGKGFLLLTGDVGVGKTALIHRLIKEIDDSKIIAYIPNPGMELLDFFNTLSLELKMGQQFSSKGAFLIEFKNFLYKNHSENKKVLLVIDEAQRLYHDLLEEIRLLSNIELENRKLINIFFVGQTEFNHILLEPRNRALRQRIAVRYQVEPLNQQETTLYIRHRLKVAGATRQIFNSNAVSEIFRFSRGCPRLINIMCDHALLTGYAAGLKTIHSNVIRECEPELRIPKSYGLTPIKPPPSEDFNLAQIETPPPVKPTQARYFKTHTGWSKYRNHPILIGLLGILIGFMGYYFLWPTTHRSMHPTTLQELTEPLDNKTETILGKRSQSDQITEDNQTQEPDEAGPIVTETELRQETLSIDVPEPAPVLLADNPPTEAAQDPLTPDKYGEISKDNNAAPVLLEEEQIAERLTDQTDNRTSPVNDENRSIFNESGASEPEKLIPISTEKKGIENLEEQTKETPLISKNGPLVSKKDPDDQEKLDDTNKLETSLPVLPSESENVVKEKSITQTESVQFDQGSASPLPKPNKAPDTKPKEPEQSGIEKAKIKTSSAVEKKYTAPDIRKDMPEQLAEKDLKKPAEKSTLAKLDPSAVSKPKSDKLEDRVRSFLDHYCNTYASKELGNFARLFGPNAKENGQSFSTLLPKYQRNFKAIEKIEYRIDLLKYKYEETENAVKIEGKFFLKWRPYGQAWRENSGKIFMDLNENGQSFMVQRLDYYGDRRN